MPRLNRLPSLWFQAAYSRLVVAYGPPRNGPWWGKGECIERGIPHYANIARDFGIPVSSAQAQLHRVNRGIGWMTPWLPIYRPGVQPFESIETDFICRFTEREGYAPDCDEYNVARLPGMVTGARLRQRLRGTWGDLLGTLGLVPRVGRIGGQSEVWTRERLIALLWSVTHFCGGLLPTANAYTELRHLLPFVSAPARHITRKLAPTWELAARCAKVLIAGHARTRATAADIAWIRENIGFRSYREMAQILGWETHYLEHVVRNNKISMGEEHGYLTVRETAEEAGMNIASVYRWVNRGWLPSVVGHVKGPFSYLIDPFDLDRWLARRRTFRNSKHYPKAVGG